MTAPEAETVEALLAGLGTDPRHGLPHDEAARRLAEVGRNELPRPPPESWRQRVARQLREPMSVLLLVAAAVSGIVLRSAGDAVAIVFIVVLNTVIATVQEGRAARALEALRGLASPDATVVRSGSPRRIPAAELVPGDVVMIAAGERVGADLRLLEAWSLEIDESLVTGESLPAAKRVEPAAPPPAQLGDQQWMAFSGTLVTSGSGRGVVVATGRQTVLGMIAGQLEEPATATPLQRQLAALSARLSKVALAVAAGVFALTMLRPGSTTIWEEAFLGAVALAVAAVPEGLPTVVTLSLALGVRRMASWGAIVRHLPAVETLGSTTVILTDKTGTLTRNRLEVEKVLTPTGIEAGIDELSPALRTAVAEVMALCNDASLDPPHGDPVEVALLQALDPSEVDRIRHSHPRRRTEPFDSERKTMSTIHQFAGGERTLSKGAPEALLEQAGSMLGDDGASLTLTDEDRRRLLGHTADLAGEGMKLLALARRDEGDLTLVSLVALRDPLRPEAAAAVGDVRAAGIKLVMVTGDHAGTASWVASQAGWGPAAVITGTEMRTRGLPADPGRYTIYARVDPDQKLGLVERFQEAGEVVAVTGDGVNDAPALHRADIGVAMGRGGTDVTREAADIVITDDNLGILGRAVLQGRTIYDNIRKVVDYLVAGNLSEIFVVLVGLLFIPALGVPLYPLQLLWINLLTDGLPALGLSFDAPHRRLLARSPRRAQLLSWRHAGELAIRGAFIAAGALAALLITRGQGAGWEEARTAMFTSLVAAHLLYAYVARLPTFTGNLRLAAAVFMGLGLQVAAVVVPGLRGLLRTVPITPATWAVTIATALVSVAILVAQQLWRRGGIEGGDRKEEGVSRRVAPPPPTTRL
jgi:calcium-translocating P-type ATPase